MKHFILAVLFIFCNSKIFSQTLSPHVISALGKSKTVGNVSMSYTVGQAATHTVTNGDAMLTQGFQQPEVQIRTGALASAYCPGSNVVVNYTATGIIGNSNVFTAQLSNASGNFASPMNIGSVTGNQSGSIICTIPNSVVAGSGYRIRVVSSLPVFNSSDNGSNIIIDTNQCNINLNVKLFIEGYYNGGGTMKPVLFNQAVITSTTICDIIIVELHRNMPPYDVMASTTAFVGTNGISNCQFNANPGNYYIVVKHRNAIQTWSSIPVNLSASLVTYDFTNSVSKAYGGNMKFLSAGKWAFYSGDLNFDENIDLLDLSNLESDINSFTYGYAATDINGDGNTDLLDSPMLEQNVNFFIFSVHP